MNKKIHAPDNLNTPGSYYHYNDDEIDIKDLIAKIWNKRKYIFIYTCVFILLGLFLSFILPVSYTASCTVVPQMGDKTRGSLGGLASMMGVNIGSSMSAETLSPYVYPQIINSFPFCKEIMETPIIVDKSNGNPITLYEYYTDKRYQPTNVMGSIKKYTIGLPGLLLSAFSSDSEPVLYSDSITGGVITISKKEQKVIGIIRNNIKFKSNDKDGYVTLGYTFSEPQPTAVIAKNLHATLEKYVTNYKSEKQLDNLAFVEDSYVRTRKDFMEKQAALAAFQDANRDLTSAMARTTERRLSSEYEVAYTVYNELAVQLEQAKISVKKSTPVLTVIDPVVVPNKKSAPKRFFILFVFVFLGVFTSISWVLIKPFVKELFSTLKEEGNEVYSDE